MTSPPSGAGPIVDDTPLADAPPSAMPLALIAAVARNGVIGLANRLPWRLPQDLRRFRALTTGHAVIMGRRTWESLPRALPDRQNIVVSRRRDFVAGGAQVAVSLDAALALVTRPPPAFCIGGGELYRLALPRASHLYLTEIDAHVDGDVTFPAIDPRAWHETAREPHLAARPGDLGFAFVSYARIRC